MFGRCDHVWEETERFYAAGNVTSMRNTSLSANELVKLTAGVTTIDYACAKCPKRYTREVLGQEVSS